MNKAIALALLLPFVAHAQTTPTVTAPAAPNLIPVTVTVEVAPATGSPAPLPAGPAPANPVPATVTPATPSTPVLAPATLSAVLDVPRTTYGELNAKLTLSNMGKAAASVVASRSSSQDCAFGPMLRVLKVGSREVVYPTPGNPKICTQDALSTDLAAGKSLTLEHKITLPAGEYMVEGWFQGGVNGAPRQVDAEPMRLTVR